MKEEKIEEKNEIPEDIPVFYTRAQLREMGQLEDDDEEDDY